MIFVLLFPHIQNQKHVRARPGKGLLAKQNAGSRDPRQRHQLFKQRSMLSCFVPDMAKQRIFVY